MDNERMDNLPLGVALSWGLVEPPKRGPKREMSIEKIVETAIAIADEEGLSAVSMSRIASTLGFTTMSLYRYVPSKDDLLLLMMDAACDIDIAEEAEQDMDWREKMRRFVRANINVIRKHPWYTDITITGVPMTPNNMEIADIGLRSTRDLPLNDYEKLSIVLLLSSYARSCGIIMNDLERTLKAGKSPGSFTGFDYSDALKKLVTPDRFPDLYPLVMSGVYTHEAEEANPIGNDFEFGLERILDGVEHYLSLKKGKERN
ncbi:TetR/AcrR family transcriptional regulator [Paenibacillus lutimineralis]|uniref:TetR/AcrR family transcriptional regulator n=1 Tax=Paenibacillus lutimineralis TaxID=2707005 RepID=A0A3S9V1M3_9BACL|nr:TetR/AcrR family transcriptional regulator [Paenibacillus lutimineralis]AZS16410.1 TetR/AcrR family transcriptional regulator [Paenibacillus lutimineralis]